MRTLLGFVFAVFFAAAAMAEERPFAHPGIAGDAERYEKYLIANWKPGRATGAELKASGDKLLGPDPRAASRNYATAVVVDGKNADAWIGLARALLAIEPAAGQESERYDLPVHASGAAYRAYERATVPGLKARALAVLSEALERRSWWRPALDAARASLALADAGETRARYEKLRAEHGFRMTEYKTESDVAAPRVCAEFSERLAGGQTDFSKFVSVGGKDPQGVSPEGSQLCVEGLVHGERYEIQIRAGLPSEVGENLETPIDIGVYVPDRKPFARFAGKSYVLPSRGQQGIPVVTVNTTKVAVEIYRVNDRNLSSVLGDGSLERHFSAYDLEGLRDKTGARVYQGEMDVASRLNEEVTTAFPVTEAIGALLPGVYAMIAKPAGASVESYEERATQWFIVSDLGLTALSGGDGIHAFVRSLADAAPVAGAGVRLVAKNNEILGTAKTDERGYARFEAGLARGEGGLAPAILVAENGAGEYAFLDLASAAFDLTDRGVKGREAPGPIDAYLYADRGVYRGGETVNLTALARDRAGKAESLPMTLAVDRPDGVEYKRVTLPDQGLGGRAEAVALPSGAMTGTWRAKLYADPKDDPIAQISFLVEDYAPERLDLALDAKGAVLKAGEPATVEASGHYLYGPPAQGLAIEADIVVKPSEKDVEGFSGYRFGLADEQIEPVRKTLEGLPGTDEQGVARLPVLLPPVPKTARPLEANLIVRLKEAGGRAIERSLRLPVDLGQPRIGVKPLFGDEGAKENETAGFEVVLLDGTGKPVSGKGLSWELSRLDTSWQWYSRNGNWAYEGVTLTRRVASGALDVAAESPAKIEAPLSYGRYRLQIASPEAEGPATSILFNAGWYAAGDTVETPEMLDVAFDKPNYAPGETAKLRIASKEGGKALVAVLEGGLLDMKEADIAKGGGEVELKVGDGWGSGVYAAALLYRPMDETAKRMPGRSIGVAWLGVDKSSRTLGVNLGAPAKIKSAQKLTVPIAITGLAAGEEARVTVAAVDVGILNLTRFESPAPEKWFYAQTRLGVEIRDFHGRLIDGMRAERGLVRSGGDGDATVEGAPPVEEMVALFSGIVTVGADGKTSVEFSLPDFNGAVRLMAVAWSASKVGHAAQDVIVRDAVALTASAPRFLTLGDEARLDLSVHNIEGPAAPYQVSVDQETLVGEDTASVRLLDRALDLAAGERKSEQVAIKPAGVGLHTYEVHVAGPGDIAVKRRLTFDVRPPAGDIRRTTTSQFPAHGGKITISADLAQDLIPSLTRVNVSVGPAASLDVPGLLSALDRYPHGCAEQIVSRALPLVYANAVAAGAGIATDAKLRERVQQAVDRVFEMQDSSGAFGAWGPSNANMWLTGYVADFLTRAKETGYAVNPRGMSQALDRLRNFLAYDARKDNVRASTAEARAYAIYVLARNGQVPIGELRYWADTKLDGFATPLAKAQLGAALSMMGDKERAEKTFAAALAGLDAEDASPAMRTDYGSLLRDHAALVTLASETGVAKAEAPRLVNVIAKAYRARTQTSTQEQAWMLLAANALGEQAAKTTLTVNGKPHTGAYQRSIPATELKAGPIVIANEGDAPVDAVVSVTGAALTPEPAISKGFKIARSYYTLDGAKIDFSASGNAVRQNDRFVVVLEIESDEPGGRVVLVDRLPAGLEIENPRLVESGDLANFAWLETVIRPEHSEFRDDRFVAAFDFFRRADGSGDNEEAPAGGGTAPGDGPAVKAVTAYVARAVTPGSFVHPAAAIEDMYRPERYARTSAGRLKVTAQE